ncbi:MAG: SIMPL domain-containing protein [Christensenellales bacterium]|jgi:uncharacterized protein YggE
MKNKTLALLAAILLIISVLPVYADVEGPQLISTGEGKVSLLADTVSFTIGVRTEDIKTKDAQNNNKQQMIKLINALKKNGIAKEDILTRYYNVESLLGYEQSNGNEPKYLVSNMIYVVLRDVNKLDSVLDAAFENGANTLWDISFSSSKAAEAYQKALKLAVENAKQNAEALAEAAGQKLGDIIEIDQSGYSPASFGIYNNMDMVAEATRDSSLITGDVSVSASVTIKYLLKKGPIFP